MKAIIENKLYDTSTATALYADGNEAFFKAPNGAYFKTGSEGIIPIPEDEMKRILGIYDADLYIKEFGEVEEA